MVEALIRVKESKLGPKEFGSIIVIKPTGSFWGSAEVKVHQLVEIPDSFFTDRQLSEMNASGALVYPFEDRDEVLVDEGTSKEHIDSITLRTSTLLVKINDLPNKEDIKNPDIEVPKITLVGTDLNERSKIGREIPTPSASSSSQSVKRSSSSSSSVSSSNLSSSSGSSSSSSSNRGIRQGPGR